jgi:hypothetical protein
MATWATQEAQAGCAQAPERIRGISDRTLASGFYDAGLGCG